MSAVQTHAPEAEVGDESLEVLENRVRQELEDVEGNELRIGQLLKKIKDSEQHGGFGKWLEKSSLPVSRRAITNYMCLADFVEWRRKEAPGECNWPNYVAYALGPHLKRRQADVRDILNALKHRPDYNQEVLRGLVSRKLKNKAVPESLETGMGFEAVLKILETDELRASAVATTGINFFDQLSKKLSKKSAQSLCSIAESFLRSVVEYTRDQSKTEKLSRQNPIPSLQNVNRGLNTVGTGAENEVATYGN